MITTNADELIKVGREMGISCALLHKDRAVEYINLVFEKFNPYKITGHLAIGMGAISIPLDEYEFSYSHYLPNEPAYVFFDQEGSSKHSVVVVNEGKQLGNLIQNCYGMEYFVSNRNIDYLLAINWYVIEGIGSASRWLATLKLA